MSRQSEESDEATRQRTRQRMRRALKRVVSPEIGSKIFILGFADGVLEVVVVGETWLEQVALQSAELLEKLNHELREPGLVTEIRLRHAAYDMDTPKWRAGHIRSLRQRAQRFLKSNAAGTEVCRECFERSQSRCPRFRDDDPVIEAATLLAGMRVDKPLPLKRARMLLEDASHVTGNVSVMISDLNMMLDLGEGDGMWSLE